ncbi:MAG: four helix bundle protein [Bacteroidetes bacterium]|nr:four helix bundle protein [Bacteroidota bacterium]MBS1540678.1 four helix bundle protein [Bacteroidota bacterium]
MHNYKELKVWKKSVDLATAVYSITYSFPKTEQYGLTQQIRRAVVSISSNIAEGAGRKYDREFSHFLSIAYGSLCELETQLLISVNLGFVSNDEISSIINEITELQKMIYTLTKTIESITV